MSLHTLKRIAILGEIGSGNLGDDAGYALLSRELRTAFDELDVMVDIRPLTPNMNWMLAGYHWDAVVTGCGTLLDMGNGPYVQALMSAAEKCPVAILGSGVSDTRHIPATTEGKIAFLELTERKARYTWLRREGEFGGPDPFWLYGWQGASDGRGTVAFNVGYAGFTTLSLDPGFLVTAAATRRLLSERGQRTALFSAWSSDNPWLNRIRAPGEDIWPVTGTKESAQPLNGCSSILCTRIHLAVLAACRGAYPVLPDYAGKVKAVFSATNVPFTALPVDADAREYVAALTAPHRIDKGAIDAALAETKKRVREAAKKLMGGW